MATHHPPSQISLPLAESPNALGASRTFTKRSLPRTNSGDSHSCSIHNPHIDGTATKPPRAPSNRHTKCPEPRRAVRTTHPSISVSTFRFRSSIISGVSRPAGMLVTPDGVMRPSAGVTRPDSSTPSASSSSDSSSDSDSSDSDSSSPHRVRSTSSSPEGF